MKNFFIENFKHLQNFGKYIKYIIDHLFCIILLISILFLSCIFLSNCTIVNPETVESQEVLIFGISLDNWGIWFTAIGLIITAVWSMYQYHKNFLIKQQEKATFIAQEFANHLVEKFGLISDTLLGDEQFRKIIKNFPLEKLKDFTVLEVLELTNNKNIFNEFNGIITSKSIQKRYSKLLKKRYSKVEQEKFDSFFPLLVENTLNKLEAVCISITSKAAGSQFIYDSLHATFLNIVQLLAIHICSNNKDNIDKYFSHIISVYNMWMLEAEKSVKVNQKTMKKIEKLNKNAEAEIKKLQKRNIRTV